MAYTVITIPFYMKQQLIDSPQSICQVVEIFCDVVRKIIKTFFFFLFNNMRKVVWTGFCVGTCNIYPHIGQVFLRMIFPIKICQESV